MSISSILESTAAVTKTFDSLGGSFTARGNRLMVSSTLDAAVNLQLTNVAGLTTNIVIMPGERSVRELTCDGAAVFSALTPVPTVGSITVQAYSNGMGRNA